MRSDQLPQRLGGAIDSLAVQIWHRLPAWQRFLVALDGRDGAGKSTIAHYLSWRLGIPSIHLDQFRVCGTYDEFHLDALNLVLSSRLENNKPIIIEGVLVLDALNEVGLRPDLWVYIQTCTREIFESDFEVRDYIARRKPAVYADLCYENLFDYAA